MPLYSNKEDKLNEVQLLQLVQPLIPEFLTVRFVSNIGQTDIFDFTGFNKHQKVALLDVKIRDIPYDDYEDIFVSTEKVDDAHQHPHFYHYILYLFNLSHVCRLYSLDDEFEKRKIKFFHKRAMQNMEKEVYVVPRSSFLYDFWDVG